MQQRRQDIFESLKKAQWLLLVGGIVILAMPFLLTLPAIANKFNYSTTGQIGDTIGGITAPFLNLIGACLLFFALKAQIKSNDLIQDQIENESKEKSSDNETNNLNQLYSYLNESIINFRFSTLPLEYLKNKKRIHTDVEFSGGEAFYHLFSQIRCHFHGTQDDLHKTQSVSELISILTIMKTLLEALEVSAGKNNKIIKTLINHQFNYKIITRIRDEKTKKLKVKYCQDCGCNHGLPEELRNLIGDIRLRLKS